MDAKVIRAFTDRFTDEVYRPGETFAGAGPRIVELVAGGYLEQPAEEPKKAAPKKPKKKTE